MLVWAFDITPEKVRNRIGFMKKELKHDFDYSFLRRPIELCHFHAS
jgi:hypothetical protein